MKLHACQNCWFNGLQYGALGLAVGYCSKHKKILNFADGTTCGFHLRKDLSVNRAQEISVIHQKHYTSEYIVRIVNAICDKADVSNSDKDKDYLRKDAVAYAVVDYGEFDSTIESLAQLKAISGARAELAMLSLGRAYVANCISRKGKWTSGLHLYWWSRSRLTEIPAIKVEDLRSVGAINLARQSSLTAWSLVMLRITFIEDITIYAGQQDDPLGKVERLTEQAALSMDTFNLRNLKKWLKNEAVPQLDANLSRSRYTELARRLNKERA